jgi:hypothetical protein
MSAEPSPQISLYEKVVEDEALEKALEDRQALRERRKKLNKEFKDSDAVVRAGLEAVELGEGSAVRVGRFVIRLSPVASREVAFTTDPTSRLQISLLPE